mmetsp:Transcript_953/g.1834  ORF Transcript_953/g.1834 Transcript_953/m.1834 type:complete len:236 (+) Transcript_953:8131-8838(+)
MHDIVPRHVCLAHIQVLHFQTIIEHLQHQTTALVIGQQLRQRLMDLCKQNFNAASSSINTFVFQLLDKETHRVPNLRRTLLRVTQHGALDERFQHLLAFSLQPRVTLFDNVSAHSTHRNVLILVQTIASRLRRIVSLRRQQPIESFIRTLANLCIHMIALVIIVKNKIKNLNDNFRRFLGQKSNMSKRTNCFENNAFLFGSDPLVLQQADGKLVNIKTNQRFSAAHNRIHFHVRL